MTIELTVEKKIQHTVMLTDESACTTWRFALLLAPTRKKKDPKKNSSTDESHIYMSHKKNETSTLYKCVGLEGMCICTRVKYVYV